MEAPVQRPAESVSSMGVPKSRRRDPLPPPHVRESLIAGGGDRALRDGPGRARCSAAAGPAFEAADGFFHRGQWLCRRSHRTHRGLRAPARIPSVAVGRGKPGFLLSGLSQPSVGLEPKLGQRAGLGMGLRPILPATQDRRRRGVAVSSGLRPVSRRLRREPVRREARYRRRRSDAAAIVRRTCLLSVSVRRPVRRHARR